MPKMKTHRGAAKRFKKTATGKFIGKNGYARHILEKKSAKRKRQLRGTCVMDKTETPKLKLLLPYL